MIRRRDSTLRTWGKRDRRSCIDEVGSMACHWRRPRLLRGRNWKVAGCQPATSGVFPLEVREDDQRTSIPGVYFVVCEFAIDGGKEEQCASADFARHRGRERAMVGSKVRALRGLASCFPSLAAVPQNLAYTDSSLVLQSPQASRPVEDCRIGAVFLFRQLRGSSGACFARCRHPPAIH